MVEEALPREKHDNVLIMDLQPARKLFISSFI